MLCYDSSFVMLQIAPTLLLLCICILLLCYDSSFLMLQVAPTFGDAPGVLRDATSKARPRLRNDEDDAFAPNTMLRVAPKQAEGAVVTMVFCAPAQYKVGFGSRLSVGTCLSGTYLVLSQGRL